MVDRIPSRTAAAHATLLQEYDIDHGLKAFGKPSASRLFSWKDALAAICHTLSPAVAVSVVFEPRIASHVGQNQAVHMGWLVSDNHGLECLSTSPTRFSHIFYQFTSINLAIIRWYFKIRSIDLASRLARSSSPHDHASHRSSTQCCIQSSWGRRNPLHTPQCRCSLWSDRPAVSPGEVSIYTIGADLSVIWHFEKLFTECPYHNMRHASPRATRTGRQSGPLFRTERNFYIPFDAGRSWLFGSGMVPLGSVITV